MAEKQNKVYIVGHKNPDTDSICSAIAYADVKNRSEDGVFQARRAGQINEETEFVLNYFGMEQPSYMPNVGMQVRDMEIHETPGASEKITVREAWDKMAAAGTVTLPITDRDSKLRGLITVGDIATYYMDAYTRTIMSDARTQYRAMAATLEGKVIAGNEHGYFVHGKVLVGAAQPERMTSVMDPDDLVILSDREDAQLKAIEAGASCLVICMGAEPSEKVVRAADKRSCVLILTELDTYTVARLINQSIPIKHLMTKKGIVAFHTDDYVDNIKTTMGRLRHRDFPVLNRQDRYVGTISRRNLINIKKKQLILIDHSEVSQAVDNLEEADILEIIDHHRIGTVETLQPIFSAGSLSAAPRRSFMKSIRKRNWTFRRKSRGFFARRLFPIR
jgi:manganese-dependent inorganic pyrophosphatase